MIGGIIITHGPIAQSLIRASEEIVGKTEYLYGFSTTNLSLDAIYKQMKEILSRSDWPDETLILVSLKGGSCWNSAVAMKREYRKVEVLSGVNLSMILSFLTKRNDHSLTDLTALVLEDGIRGIDRHS